MSKNKNRLGLAKYVALVVSISIICFIGSLVGIKLMWDGDFDNDIRYAIINFVSLFALGAFCLISLWMTIGSIISAFNLFKVYKTKFVIRSILFSLLCLGLFGLAAVSITFFSFLLKDFFYQNWNSFNSSWWERSSYFFKYYLEGDQNKNFIITFVFAISWSIAGIIYNVANRMLNNGETKQPKVKNIVDKKDETVANNENTTNNEVKEEQNLSNDSAVESTNNETANEQKNNEVLEETSKPQVVEEIDDWGASSWETPTTNNVNENVSSTPKNVSEDDPYSIFD